jgi:hypothetical protein
MRDLPDPPDGFKYMPCRHCDKPMLVGATKTRTPGHIECGIERAVEVQRQMAAKEGVYYQRWRMGMALAAERSTGGGAPVTGGGEG